MELWGMVCVCRAEFGPAHSFVLFFQLHLQHRFYVSRDFQGLFYWFLAATDALFWLRCIVHPCAFTTLVLAYQKNTVTMLVVKDPLVVHGQ